MKEVKVKRNNEMSKTEHENDKARENEKEC